MGAPAQSAVFPKFGGRDLYAVAADPKQKVSHNETPAAEFSDWLDVQRVALPRFPGEFDNSRPAG
ncbi:MAG: hypothetical protein ACRD4R_04360 [Candidatus Acidiferrales bacterium]